MGTPLAALYSTKHHLGINFSTKISARLFNKHLVCNRQTSVCLPYNTVNFSPFSSLQLNSAKVKHSHLLKPVKCAIAENPSSNFQFQVLFDKPRGFSFDSIKEGVFNISPVSFLDMVVLALVCGNWGWIYGVYCFRKHSRGEANAIEQLAVVSSAFTWLTLVLPGFFNGFLEGWPFVFFDYQYFFFNVSIRLYGDYNMKQHDRKWDVSVPGWYQTLFCVGVMVGHWLAAFEGPELHLIPGGWNNAGMR